MHKIFEDSIYGAVFERTPEEREEAKKKELEKQQEYKDIGHICFRFCDEKGSSLSHSHCEPVCISANDPSEGVDERIMFYNSIYIDFYGQYQYKIVSTPKRKRNPATTIGKIKKLQRKRIMNVFKKNSRV